MGCVTTRGKQVVQPLLGQHFTITGDPRFCTLPSYTLYARRSVLAGGPPAAWAKGKKAASRSEETLLAENLGLGKADVERQAPALDGRRHDQGPDEAEPQGEPAPAVQCADLPDLRRVP